jgi:hypothetical protein
MAATRDIQHGMVNGVYQEAAVSHPTLPPTYSTSVTGLVPRALGATDLFTIENPVGSTILIHVWVVAASGTAVVALTVDMGIVKRSTLNSGGTFTTPATVAHDSQNPPAQATVKAYTNNASSLGALVGTKRSVKFPLLASGVAVSTPTFEIYSKAGKPQQPYTLRAGELLGINLGSLAIVGGSMDLVFEWTESAI